MKPEVQYPEVHLLVRSSKVRRRFEFIFEEFPGKREALKAFVELSRDQLMNVVLVEDSLAPEFLRSVCSRDESGMVFNRSIILSDATLSSETKLQFYEQGFHYVADASTSPEAFRSRVEDLLSLNSRIHSYQLTNRRATSDLRQQRELLRNQDEFLQMAVHDLRSPLSAMVCYAELLMEGVLGNLEASQLEPIRTIHRNCQFLIDMVTDLLDSAKIGSGKLQLNLSLVDFTQEVKLIIESLKGLADTKNITIRLQAEPVPKVHLDSQKVSRILSNLLGNAIKFTKLNGQIILRIAQRENFLVFSIQDTGPGIPPADMGHLFEKFQIGEDSNLKGKGHGLGLAITKSFVELHGGKLFVESVRNRGSTFIAHLPIEKRQEEGKRPFRKTVLTLDLGHDLGFLREERVAKHNSGLAFKNFPVEQWAKGKKWPLERVDFVLFNESPDCKDYKNSILLLALSSFSNRIPCAVVAPPDLPEVEKELRRSLGLLLLDKNTSDEALLELICKSVGSDRRKTRR